jgi:hypothetical protein
MEEKMERNMRSAAKRVLFVALAVMGMLLGGTIAATAPAAAQPIQPCPEPLSYGGATWYCHSGSGILREVITCKKYVRPDGQIGVRAGIRMTDNRPPSAQSARFLATAYFWYGATWRQNNYAEIAYYSSPGEVHSVNVSTLAAWGSDPAGCTYERNHYAF